jgi:hypothetical protein
MRSRHSTIAAIVVAIALLSKLRRRLTSFTATTASQSSTEHGAIPQRAAAEGSVGFVERVKREFAELNGVDVSKVLVNFQIIG